MKRPFRTYIRVGILPLSYLDNCIGVSYENRKKSAFKKYETFILDGVECRTKLSSERFFPFKESQICKKCGLKASFLAIERGDHDPSYHINMYGVLPNGDEMLFTKDHITPRSKGGWNKKENYQTMCSCCNSEKANNLEETIKCI